jgi:hypothetical protein
VECGADFGVPCGKKLGRVLDRRDMKDMRKAENSTSSAFTFLMSKFPL